MNQNLLEEIIEKHSYIVKVTLDSDDSLCVMVDFAGRKQAYYRVISDEEGEVYGLGYWSSIMDENEEFIPLNKSVIRLYILGDIYRQCRDMELSYEIVRYLDADGNRVEFVDLLDLSLDENEADVEQALEECVSRILNGSVSLKVLEEALEKDGILHQFNVIKATLV